MKKLLIGAVSAVALSFAFGGSAGAAPGISQFCTDNGDFGVSHGECTSILQNAFNNGNSTPVGICKFVNVAFPAFFDANWKNLGDCVSDLRHL